MESSIDQNIYSLDYVVRSCLADIDEPDSSPLYTKFLKWANDGYRRLNLAGLMPITMKSVVLDVDSATNTAELPNDYLYYLKIGLCIEGRIVNFDLADSLCLSPNEMNACPCSDEEIEQGINNILATGDNWTGASWYFPYYQHYHNGQFVAGFYGNGAGFYHGGYKINKTTNRIQFDSFVRAPRITLEYVSSGVNSTGDAIIEQTAIPALMAYVHKQRCAFSKDRNEMMKYGMYSNIFTKEARGLNTRQNALTTAEWYQLFRKFTYQTPKR